MKSNSQGLSYKAEKFESVTDRRRQQFLNLYMLLQNLLQFYFDHRQFLRKNKVYKLSKSAPLSE